MAVEGTVVEHSPYHPKVNGSRNAKVAIIRIDKNDKEEKNFDQMG
jgi:hypothetical protein